MFIVRSKNFQITRPWFGLSPFLFLSLRDCGCGKALLFDGFFRKDLSDKMPAGEELKVPADLRKALAGTPKANAQWSDLTPIARRDFISWIDSAKQLETRKRRIGKACSMLADGKRRPCCYSIVSFNLYSALAATPRAKAQWSDLTPIERRDFISWMDSARQPEKHRQRIEKACAMLAAGKRCPDVFQSGIGKK